MVVHHHTGGPTGPRGGDVAGERVTASIAPLQLKQNGMSYTWDGVVTRAGTEKPNKRGA